MGGPSIPAPAPPTPAPKPKPVEQTDPKGIQEASRMAEEARRRRNRAALRIPLGGDEASGSGLVV